MKTDKILLNVSITSAAHWKFQSFYIFQLWCLFCAKCWSLRKLKCQRLVRMYLKFKMSECKEFFFIYQFRRIFIWFLWAQNPFLMIQKFLTIFQTKIILEILFEFFCQKLFSQIQITNFSVMTNYWHACMHNIMQILIKIAKCWSISGNKQDFVNTESVCNYWKSQ